MAFIIIPPQVGRSPAELEVIRDSCGHEQA